MGETARVFYGLWPTPAEAAQLIPHATVLKAATRGRPSHPASLHLTLVFLGEVPVDVLPQLRNLEVAGDRPGFDLALDRRGVWRHNGIGWLMPSTPPPALLELQSTLEAALRAAGFESERRPFRPHVTLTRHGRDDMPDGAIDPVVWRVREWVLVRSNGTAVDGSRYETLARFPLRQP
ncbi:MAG: RNA 2',3'-cyclic phosphodiesterase [Burkholderiales bacterium]|nr:RNA 2',3'-cyclic phosphodiesterase [Burkholderiales bacterium]